MSKINENKAGYKKTKVGWIPNDWEIPTIWDSCEILVSPVDKKTLQGETPVRLCNYTDVYYNRKITGEISFMVASASKREIDRYTLRQNDVVITKDSEGPDDIAVPALIVEGIENLVCGYHLAILRSKSVILPTYLAYVLQKATIRHEFYKYAVGVTRFGLTTDTYKKVCLPLPPMPEQKKIAEILSTWNDAIQAQEKLIEQKKKLKKALMQRVLMGNKKVNGLNSEWMPFKLGKVFKERKEVKRGDLPLLAVTRERGIIPAEDTGRKDSSAEDKSKYKRVMPGDIAYNTMRMWQGVSALSDKEGIVSPAYTVCIPSKVIDALFASYLFKHPPIIHLFYRYSQGLVSDTLNLKFHNFAEITVSLPEVKEQKKIAEILWTIDKEINDLNRITHSLKKQKRELMQKLLTGNVRVKTTEMIR